jgi:RNA polymerase sigma-70 factor (ECF subfamily)
MVEDRLKQLIEGCKRQNRNSQQLLYQEFYNFAMKICIRFVSNRYEASEVLNDGFFKALTNIEKYDGNRPFKTWLSKIMYNASIDYYRSNLKNNRMEELDLVNGIEIDAEIEKKLEYDDLLTMVQNLSPSYRAVFNLYAIDCYSHEEIAKVLGISEGASRSNLHKARQKLKQMVILATTVNTNSEPKNFYSVSINQKDIDGLFYRHFRL